MKKVFYPESERGRANYGWLKATHSFSFARYYDPNKMGFETLRVLNDDLISGGMGFGSHPHNNMEIITIPLSGTLEHKDSMGNTGIIKPGEVQVMSAGSGVVHSEFNASKVEPLSLFQIWIESRETNLAPRYDQKFFESTQNKWNLVVSSDGRDDSLIIYQDAYLSLAQINSNESLDYIKHSKMTETFYFVIEGEVNIADQVLKTRDALGIYGDDPIVILAKEDSKILVIETARL